MRNWAKDPDWGHGEEERPDEGCNKSLLCNTLLPSLCLPLCLCVWVCVSLSDPGDLHTRCLFICRQLNETPCVSAAAMTAETLAFSSITSRVSLYKSLLRPLSAARVQSRDADDAEDQDGGAGNQRSAVADGGKLASGERQLHRRGRAEVKIAAPVGR